MQAFVKKPGLIIVVLVFVFLVTTVAMFFYGRDFIQNKQIQILNLNRDLAVNEIEQEFRDIESTILAVGSYINSNDNNDELLNFLIDIDDNYDVISSIYFGMPDKTMINSSGFVPPPTFDLTTRLWYQMALSNPYVVYTDAFINATNDKVIITVAYALYDEFDQIIGVVAADIDIRSIVAFVNEITDESGGYAFLYDDSNNVIAHPSQVLEDISLVSASTFSIPIEALNEDFGITDSTDVDGVKGIISFSKINDTGYTFGVFMSNTELYQNIRALSVVTFALLLVTLAVVAVILMITNIYIKKPLDKLVLDIKKITPEDNFKYRLPIEKENLIDVRIALNDLLQSTQDYQTVAEYGLDELSLKNQKLNLLLESASDMVFRIGLDKKYIEIYGNGIQSIFRKEESDFIGNTFEEVFGVKLAEERNLQYDLAFRGQKVYYTWKYEVENKLFYFETVISPLIDLNDKIIGAVGVTRDITEQQLRFEEMHYISTHDYLTGLYNRRHYIETLERLDAWKQYPFAVLNLDVNGLKIINDAYGHEVGDIALNKTAEVLLANCEDKHIVSRVSGDEFTVVVPDADKKQVDKLKEKLFKNFSKVKINNLSLSVAIGYYIKTDDSIDIDEVRKLAENDMYRQKVSERRSVKNKAISAILKTLTEKFEAEKIHSERVAEFSFKLGKAINLNNEDLTELKTAALFHDIGKISIPDEIINKPTKLTDREFEIMKTHTEVGYEILRAADEYSSLAIHASSHHERYDGKGYPRGLKGEKIPLFSRIICIADAYEAMTADRPYRKSKSIEYAASEIIKFAGTQFDPKLAKVFVEDVLEMKWKNSEKN